MSASRSDRSEAGTPAPPVPVTDQTPDGRELAKSWAMLALLLTACAVPLAGSWVGKALGGVGLLVAGIEAIRLILQSAYWARFGQTTLSYDWADALPGHAVVLTFTSSRKALAKREWTVRLSCLQARRRNGIREETPLWEGAGRVDAVESTPTGSRVVMVVPVPTTDDAPWQVPEGVVDWHVDLIGTGGRQPLKVTLAFAAHADLADAGRPA